MLAIFRGSLEMVKLLINIGKANPNTPENKGYTPFMAACSTGNCYLLAFSLNTFSINYQIFIKTPLNKC